MKQIIAVQWFQMKKDKTFPILAIGGLLLSVALAFVIYMETQGIVELTGEFYIISGTNMGACVVSIFLLLMAGYIMVKDFGDKTICYEIQYGYSRRDIFLGRVMISVIVCSVFSILFMITPVILISIKSGFGNLITLKSFCFRLFIFLILTIRLVSEIVFIAVVVKKIHLTYIVGVILGMLEMQVSIVTKFPYITYFNSCISLFWYDMRVMLHINGELETIVIEQLPFTTYGPIVASSLLIMFICFFGAYKYFENDDI